MLLILKKTAYILIIVAVNTYICSYLAAKLSARMELRRGYRETRIGGIGFPAIRFLSHLSKDHSAGIWSYMIFIFSMLLWTAAPFSAELSLVDMDSNLIMAILFLFTAVILNLAGPGKTGYGVLMGQASKRIVYAAAVLVPFVLCIASLVLAGRTFNLNEIVGLQREYWNIVYQPLGFIISVLSAALLFKVSGLGREGVQGIAAADTGGSGFAGAVSRFSHYSIILFMIYLITLLYLGGYKDFYFIRGYVMLGIKFYAVFVFMLFSAKALGSDLSDNRIFMRISVKFLIPLSLINLVITLGFFIYTNIYGLA